MAVILVTGASGQLGSELRVSSKNNFGYEYIFTDNDTLDVTIEKEVKEFISKNKPDWIINCASYNFVDKAESEPDKAMLVNAAGVKNIVASIRGSECRLIHISTDYVFDGKSNVPYNEYSVPNPLSAYAKSKSEGERFALTHYLSIILRTSWLYSSWGNNFVKTILKNGAEKDSLRVVFDQTGTPTYAADLADTIMLIISRVIRNQIAFNAGIYHYSNEGVCSWYDLANEIVLEAGLKCRVVPILSKEYPSIVQRPFYSVLDKSKIKENYTIEIPHWRSGLSR
ncbi:MAG: dTDP-4-dehydrorhamnose reductase, partial [Bacteroidales bacterium]